MKTLITTLNSKYIHTSLALRLLYVATYHDFDIDFKEYTIKDSLEHIVDDLLSMHLDVIAFLLIFGILNIYKRYVKC